MTFLAKCISNLFLILVSILAFPAWIAVGIHWCFYKAGYITKEDFYSE
jgi:hypothetical protein